MGGGKGIFTWTLTSANAEAGTITIIVNNNIFNNDFFIGLPPLFVRSLKRYSRVIQDTPKIPGDA